MLAVALTMAALVLASQQDICGAQLSIHTDSNTNSFSLKAPGLQQTFTRYYGGARTQPQEAEQPQQEQALVQQQQQQQQLQLQQQQLQQQQQQQEQLYNQYNRLTRLRGGAKPNQFTQQQQQLNLQQQQQLQQQQALLAQSGFGSPASSGPGVTSYADQMQAAFLDYQRQRAEFEQQQQQQQLQQQHQQQLLQRFYQNYPDVSGTQAQQQQQQQQQSAEGLQSANGFVYQRPQFLQSVGSVAPQRAVGASDFYSTQQQQDQQQQQFATSQITPNPRQNFGMAVPMSTAPSAPTFQHSSDVSHVSFSSGNLKYNF